MIADLLVLRSDGHELLKRLGGGDKNDGLSTVEWQVDGLEQDRIERVFGSSGRWW